MADPSTEDFLDAPEPAPPAYAEETLASSPARRGFATWMSTGAWLLAGLVIGALVVAMLHNNTSTNATGVPGAPAANQLPNGQLPGGPPAGGFGSGFGGGFRGGLPGEQHVVGTLAAVGASSITVKSTGGTATYPIESSTLLIKDGQHVSSTSTMKVGDTVVVHVYPQDGTTHTEMVIDGVPPDRGGVGGRDDDTTGTTAET